MHCPTASTAGAFFIGSASSENGGSEGKAQTNCLGRIGVGRVRGLGFDFGSSGGAAGLAVTCPAGIADRGLAAGDAAFGREVALGSFERAGVAGFGLAPAGGVCGGDGGCFGGVGGTL
jgi:hypothetical protein